MTRAEIRAIDASGAESAAVTVTVPSVWVDSFDGASDDEKLTNALAYAAAQTFPPTLRFSHRKYTFSVGNRQPFDGMRLAGPPGFNNPEKFTQTKMTHRIHLTGFSGGWFHNASGQNLFSISLMDLCVTGGSGCSLITNDSASRFTCLYMSNISTNGLRSVCGSSTQALTITASMFNGYWQVANCYSSAFHLSGSDNRLFMDGGLLDSSPAHHAAGGEPAGTAHLRCSWLDYTTIGGLFITAEGPWRAVTVAGPAYGAISDNNGAVLFDGLVMQGRNETQPCHSAVVKVTGGQARFRDCWFDDAMAAPSATGDQGVIHHSGGYLAVRDPGYNKTPGQPETVPFIYSTGANSRGYVRDATVGVTSGGWTGVPRVQKVNGSLLTFDASVTLA